MKTSKSRLIRNLQAKRDVNKLTQIMQDTTKSAELRGAAAVALFDLGAITLDSLVEAAIEDHGYAARALIKIGKPGVEPLIAALEKGGYRAAWVLGAIGDNRAVDALRVALKSENEEARRSAAWALDKIADARASEPDNDATKDASDIDRKEASEGLEKMPPEVCGSCGQEFPKGAGAPGQKVDLFKMTAQPGLATHSKKVNESYIDGGTRRTMVGTVYWQETSVLIPCCKACAAKSEKQKKLSPLIGFLVGLIINVPLYVIVKRHFGSVDAAFWFLAVVLVVIATGTGFLIGPARIGDRARKYPAVKALLNDGWDDRPNPFRTDGKPVEVLSRNL
mgnify:CR=1 FL=1